MVFSPDPGLGKKQGSRFMWQREAGTEMGAWHSGRGARKRGWARDTCPGQGSEGRHQECSEQEHQRPPKNHHGGSRARNPLQADGRGSQGTEQGECVCVGTGARGEGGELGARPQELLRRPKPRCLTQVEARWPTAPAESCAQSGARACSIRNNYLSVSRGCKWEHVPDRLTQLAGEVQFKQKCKHINS